MLSLFLCVWYAGYTSWPWRSGLFFWDIYVSQQCTPLITRALCSRGAPSPGCVASSVVAGWRLWLVWQVWLALVQLVARLWSVKGCWLAGLGHEVAGCLILLFHWWLKYGSKRSHGLFLSTGIRRQVLGRDSSWSLAVLLGVPELFAWVGSNPNIAWMRCLWCFKASVTG